MAYRYEQNPTTQQQELIIDGFEKGIADSPFKGIANIRNLNVKYYEGVAYMNYKRQACTIQNANGVSTGNPTVTIASPAVFTLTSHGLNNNDTVVLSTTGALPTGFSINTTYYVVNTAANTFNLSLTRGGSAITSSGTQSGTHTFTLVIDKPFTGCQSPAGIIYVVDTNRTIFKQTGAGGSTFKTLSGNATGTDIVGIAFWNNYILTFGGGTATGTNVRIEICGDGTGDNGVTSSNWNNTQYTDTFTVTIATPGVLTSSVAHNLQVGDIVRLTTTGALPTGLVAGSTYYVISAGLTSTNFELSATSGGAAINTSGSQSGFHTFEKQTGLWPIIGGTTITLGSAPAGGDVSASSFSYVDPAGHTVAFWNGPTGVYELEVPLPTGNQKVLALFTQGSGSVSWTPALNHKATSAACTLGIHQSSTQTVASHMTLIAANTGDCYFCNGSNVGAVTLNSQQTFAKGDMGTFGFNVAALSLPPTETSNWLMELRNQLLVLGQFNMYPWDFFSPFWQNPVPLNELFTKGINILNNLYIFAGNKGNIYISNGYSITRYRKLPDYIAGVVDPEWLIGGVMQHRQKLCFQATAYNGQSGSVIFQGIFSIDLDTGALVMEGQNSGGLTPSGLTYGGILIDNTSTAITYDKYYSAFGANVSRIDYNDTTLYSSDEAMIETDIIPVGSFAEPKTLAQMEFKTDQPLQSGDTVKVYIRESLTASYQLFGQTSAAQLSDLFSKTPISKMQWAQFKLLFSCNGTSTASSFIRLREIRVRSVSAQT